MPRLYVVFDANAYIALPKDELPGLVLRERGNGVVAWASYFVVEELLARCASADPRRAGGGVAALKRLAQHCQTYDGSYERVNFVADPRQQVAELLYGKAQFHDQSVIDTYIDTYGTVVKTIAASASPAEWPAWVHEATHNIRAEIEAAEARFADGMFEGVVKALVPEARTWADIRTNASYADALAAGVESDEGLMLCAGLFADELAELAGVEPTQRERDRAVALLKDAFQLPLRINNALMFRIMKDGVNVRRPEIANTIWDMQIAMTIPVSNRFVRTPLWFVSGDGAFSDAAQTAGVAHIVHRLDAYMRLTLDGDALREMIGRFEGSA
jgi:hypothetical protein